MQRAMTQKLINNGDAAVDEMLDGVMAAHGDLLVRLDGAPRAIVARHGPRPGKVALVIGGGSGHEPTFLGYVGKGLADAAAIGNVFASPPPQPAVDAALAAHGGAGVLFMYGNYAGDVMNFDMATELLELEGVEARTVLTTDDIASAPRDRMPSAIAMISVGASVNGISGRTPAALAARMSAVAYSGPEEAPTAFRNPLAAALN
jgi:dihydroxyacetone kinase-like protein